MTKCLVGRSGVTDEAERGPDFDAELFQHARRNWWMNAMDQNSHRWYVLYTKPRFEKKVHLQLLQKQIESYLPLHKVTRLWSDRKKKVEEALFPNYVFVHTQEKERLASLETAGVVC